MGFTLVEMLISLSIMGVIAAALGSTIVLASRALDQQAGPAASGLATRRATDRMLSELAVATAFSERTATSVAFTVPDRDGDGLPETVRYAWSGVAGDPLTRQYNGGAPAAFADDVRRFDLTYLLRTVDPPPPKEIESAEQLLIGHDNAPGGTMTEQSLQDKNACGAYFKPVLPAGTLRWKITRVAVVARRPSVLAAGTVYFDLTAATAAGKPGSQVLATSGVSTTTMPLMAQWKSVAFTADAITNLAPGQAVCLVARTSDPTVQAVFQLEQGATPMTPNTHWLKFNSVTGWSGTQDVSDMRFAVYGTVTTGAP